MSEGKVNGQVSPTAEREVDRADRCAFVVGDDGLARLAEVQAEAWFGLQRAHRELTRKLESSLLASHGLSLSALELLGRLADADRRRRLGWLADDIELSVSRVSRIVDDLERRHLVERQPCPEDTRATNVWLTDAGLILAREAQAAHLAEVQGQFFDHLSDAELRTLAQVFKRLGGSSTKQ